MMYLPADWKTANVTPIFKKGNKGLPENYRPISLTSQCSKLLEAMVRDGLTEFLEANCTITANSMDSGLVYPVCLTSCHFLPAALRAAQSAGI